MKIKPLSEEIKQFILIVVLILTMIAIFAIPSFCQEPPPITFKSVQGEIFFQDKHDSAPGGLLIDFRDGYLITSGTDQTNKIFWRGDWEEHIFETTGVPNIRIQGIDDGGFKCFLNFGYDEKVKHYFLWISYRNVSICHWLLPTDEFMWDELYSLPIHDVSNRIEYSDAEIISFINKFSFLFEDFSSLDWINW